MATAVRSTNLANATVPPEQEIAQRLGVPRTILREALSGRQPQAMVNPVVWRAP
jgi:DNA-binding FadR family transcriptional regulator